MKTNNGEILITNIQRYCMHDGVGVRTVVFFQGCPLNCKWCHNPETKSITPKIMLKKQLCINCKKCALVCPNGAQIFDGERNINRNLCNNCGKCAIVCPAGALELSSKKMTVDEIIETVKLDRAFYGKDGGLTVSGGEPTFQMDGLIELLKKSKEIGISTCVETCGVFNSGNIDQLVKYTDMVLYDIKDTDSKRLKDNTNANYGLIMDNLLKIDSLNVKTVIRCILIPNVNNNKEHFENVYSIYCQLKNVQYIEILPYHPYGNSKGEQLGENYITYNKPSEEEVKYFANFLNKKGARVKCFSSMVK